MLTHLHISNYTIVSKLDVELNKGMTAITGETGAGKSIMLDALGLCVGDRADPKAVRNGQARAENLSTHTAIHVLRIGFNIIHQLVYLVSGVGQKRTALYFCHNTKKLNNTTMVAGGAIYRNHSSHCE